MILVSMATVAKMRFFVSNAPFKEDQTEMWVKLSNLKQKLIEK